MAMDAQNPAPRFLILDRVSGQVVGECHGAGDLGTCPNTLSGELLPCAGCRVRPLGGSGVEGWTLSVAPDATDTCPLAFVPVRDA
jgi:hypothetical protein